MVSKMEIKLGEHVFSCGSTGCGKTTLTRQYLQSTNHRVFVLDTKGTFNWSKDYDKKSSLFITSIHDLKKFNKNVKKMIYRPNENELEYPYYDAFFKFVYKHKKGFYQDCIIYIDELSQVCKNALNFPRYLKHLYERGREFRISVWSSSQRPRVIPTCSMSEATHLFIFRLNNKKDRIKVADDCSNDAFLEKLEGFNFLYWRGDKDFKPVESIINMKGKK